jgi:hypothetical protein
MVVTILLVILCFLLGAAAMYICLVARGRDVEKKEFKKSQSKVLNGLKEKKDIFDKELTQEHLIKQEELRRSLEQLNRNYNKEK